jgi:hypothetical protein
MNEKIMPLEIDGMNLPHIKKNWFMCYIVLFFLNFINMLILINYKLYNKMKNQFNILVTKWIIVEYFSYNFGDILYDI